MTVRPFGALPDGRHVDLYSITADGIELHAMTYGGIISSLKVPDRYGEPGEVVLGHSDVEPYLLNASYFGAIIGGYANRIAYPGTLSCSVTYLLIAPGSVELQYDAVTDAATIVNLTQHANFNLASETSTSVLDHELTIHASYYTPVNRTLIPTGQIASVDETAFDFRQPIVVRRALGATHPQLGIAGGFDHNFILHRRWAGLVRAATLHERRSGRVLHVSTTEPGLQFYDGRLLDGAMTGAHGRVFDRCAGLCLETQHYPDSPHQRISPLSNCGPPNGIARRCGGSF